MGEGCPGVSEISHILSSGFGHRSHCPFEEMKSEFDTLFWRSRVNLFICFYFYFFVCALAHMYSHVVWLSFEANYMA